MGLQHKLFHAAYSQRLFFSGEFSFLSVSLKRQTEKCIFIAGRFCLDFSQNPC